MLYILAPRFHVHVLELHTAYPVHALIVHMYVPASLLHAFGSCTMYRYVHVNTSMYEPINGTCKTTTYYGRCQGPAGRGIGACMVHVHVLSSITCCSIERERSREIESQSRCAQHVGSSCAHCSQSTAFAHERGAGSDGSSSMNAYGTK